MARSFAPSLMGMVIVFVLFCYAFIYFFAPHDVPQSTKASSGRPISATSAADLFAVNETLTNLRQELKTLMEVQKEIHDEHKKHIEGDKEIEDLERQQRKPAASKHFAPPRGRSGGSAGGATKPIHVVTSPRQQPPPSVPDIITHTAKHAVLFTMDSITSYEENSHKGGAAGEILIRHSLEHAFKKLGVELRVVKSDREFETISGADYDIIIVDPWTWAAKGWVPKPPLRGQDSKVYVLDFFGSQRLRGKGLVVPPERFLTAFGAPGNTFLGYFTPTPPSTANSETKLPQGVVWGKDPKHFEGKTGMLNAVLNREPSLHLLATATHAVFKHPRMEWRGHQTSQGWQLLLKQSKFLIGLGDPLLGPSAVDAITAGCMYLNPIYPEGRAKKGYFNQHPYVAEKIGEPYVCNYQLGDAPSLQACVKKALNIDLKPLDVKDFTEKAYLERVKRIFQLTSSPSSRRRLQAQAKKDPSWMFQSERKWDEQWSRGNWDYMDVVPVERAKHAVVSELMSIYSSNSTTSTSSSSSSSSSTSTLDVGCGEGTLYGFLEPERKKGYVGIDLSREAIQAARRKRGGGQGQGQGQGQSEGRFVHAAAHTFTPKRRQHKFETVIFSDVLYYVDHESVLRRYNNELLSDQGIVIISIFQKPDSPKIMYENIFSAARLIFDKVDEMHLSGTTRKTAHSTVETVAPTGFWIEAYRKK